MVRSHGHHGRRAGHDGPAFCAPLPWPSRARPQSSKAGCALLAGSLAAGSRHVDNSKRELPPAAPARRPPLPPRSCSEALRYSERGTLRKWKGLPAPEVARAYYGMGVGGSRCLVFFYFLLFFF